MFKDGYMFLELAVQEKLKIHKDYQPTSKEYEEFTHYQKKNIASINQQTATQNIAVIDIIGVLTCYPDILAMLFGGGNTTYQDITQSIQAANVDSNITSIQLNIDSPGGEVNGLFTLLDFINTVNKPINTYVINTCASAAYGIASQTNMITAANRGARIGSIGVATEQIIRDNIVRISSKNAPNKVPDINTSAGREIIQAELDSIESLFLEYIANGRNTTIDNIIQNYGQGAVFLADDAKNRGMIDTISGGIIAKCPDEEESARGGNLMNTDEIKAKYPEAYEAIYKMGIDKERDRVVSHLTMAEASLDWPTAVKAIKDGSTMTDTISAQYMAAALNRKTQDQRIKDEDAIPEFEAKTDDTNKEDQILSKIEAATKSLPKQ